jgi:hypothetical protein
MLEEGVPERSIPEGKRWPKMNPQKVTNMPYTEIHRYI